MPEEHKPYAERTDHPCDFKVRYRFFSEADGGRKSLPHQGIRSDFRYEHPDHAEKKDWLFIIWPEFEDSDGELIRSGTVLPEGVARMWILNDELRGYHAERITVGTKGWFKEGSRSTAECEVIELVGLVTNPRELNRAK
jgi:hypothetical protein